METLREQLELVSTNGFRPIGVSWIDGTPITIFNSRVEAVKASMFVTDSGRLPVGYWVSRAQFRKDCPDLKMVRICRVGGDVPLLAFALIIGWVILLPVLTNSHVLIFAGVLVLTFTLLLVIAFRY